MATVELIHAGYIRDDSRVGSSISLIRDGDAIVIADPRVVSKSYGATLMRALPPARRILSGWNEISRQLHAFYSVSE